MDPRTTALILSDCTSARTPVEQDFFCENDVPLYGGVARSSDLVAELVPVAA